MSQSEGWRPRYGFYTSTTRGALWGFFIALVPTQPSAGVQKVQRVGLCRRLLTRVRGFLLWWQKPGFMTCDPRDLWSGCSPYIIIFHGVEFCTKCFLAWQVRMELTQVWCPCSQLSSNHILGERVLSGCFFDKIKPSYIILRVYGFPFNLT